MGVEHTQPEKGRKLVIDIGGGSTELVIGEDFEPLLAESRRMGCVSFAQLFFPGGEISKTTSAARGWRRAEAGNAGTAVPHSGLAVRAGRLAPSRPPTKCWWRWGKKTVSSPDRTEMLAEQVLQFKLRLAEPAGAVGRSPIGVRAGAGYPVRRVRCAGDPRSAPVRRRCAKACCMKWKAVSATGTSAAAPPKAADHYNIDREQAKRVLETTELLYSQWMAQNTKLAHPQLEALLKWAAMLHEVG